MNIPGYNPFVPPPVIVRAPASLPDMRRGRGVTTAQLKRVAQLAVKSATKSARSAPSKKKFSDRVKGVVGADIYSDMYNALTSMRYDFTSWFATAIGVICLIRFGSDLSGLTASALPASVKSLGIVTTLLSLKMQLIGIVIMLPSVIDFTPSQFPAAHRISRPIMAVMIIVWCFVVPESSVLYFSIQNFLIRVLMRTRLPSSYALISSLIILLWYVSFTTTGKAFGTQVHTAATAAIAAATKDS